MLDTASRTGATPPAGRGMLRAPGRGQPALLYSRRGGVHTSRGRFDISIRGDDGARLPELASFRRRTGHSPLRSTQLARVAPRLRVSARSAHRYLQVDGAGRYVPLRDAG